MAAVKPAGPEPRTITSNIGKPSIVRSIAVFYKITVCQKMMGRFRCFHMFTRSTTDIEVTLIYSVSISIEIVINSMKIEFKLVNADD